MSFYAGQRVRTPDGDVGTIRERWNAGDGTWWYVEGPGLAGPVRERCLTPHFLPGDEARVRKGASVALCGGSGFLNSGYDPGVVDVLSIDGERAEVSVADALRCQVSVSDLIPVKTEPPKEEAKPVEFKIGDRVKTDAGMRGTVKSQYGNTGLVVENDEGSRGVWYGDQLTLLPKEEAPVKEEAGGIPSIFLPGTVETVTRVGDWHYIGIDTPRGIVNFPLKREEVEGIRIGQEYAVSLRKGN